jgi:carboxypeptidase D
MIIRFGILFLCLIFHGLLAGGQDQQDFARLKQLVNDYGQAEVVVRYPGYNKASELSRLFSVDRYDDGNLHIILSKRTVEAFAEYGIRFTVREPSVFKGLTAAASVSKAMTWQEYPTYTQYDSIMRKLAGDYPALCRLDTIGTSINGKQVLVLKISDYVNSDEAIEPEVFYTSTMHGDELAGFVLLLRLADYLLVNYAVDSRVKALVDNLQIYINPLANPDGTYRTGNVITTPTRFNANGEDLNRNFPDPLQPAEVQERENIDMIAFMRGRRFVLSANFHSGDEVVNYPWDRWYSKLHADNDWFRDLSRAYADTVHLYSPPTYMDGFDNGVVRGAEWYVIYGGRQDFVTWELQGREVTIELDNTKWTPAGKLEDMWVWNYRSLLNYLSYARYGLRGQVTNNLSGDPVGARIFIEGYDKDSSHIYSDTATGYFSRLLNAGTYNMRFTSPGYRDTVISEIAFSRVTPTFLNIEMEPLPIETDSVPPRIIVIAPNPSVGNFSILLPVCYTGEVRLEVYSQNGTMMRSFVTTYSPFIPIIFDCTEFATGVYTITARAVTGGVVARGRALIVR